MKSPLQGNRAVSDPWGPHPAVGATGPARLLCCQEPNVPCLCSLAWTLPVPKDHSRPWTHVNLHRPAWGEDVPFKTQEQTLNEPVLCVRPMVSMLHQGCTVTTTDSQMGKLRPGGLLRDPIANKSRL